MRPAPLEKRFSSKVDRSGGPAACWPWKGAWRTEKGYGRILKDRRKGRALRAHRVAWELAHGPIPLGLCVCHACDNPPCCNPAHLFLGTMLDNNRDRDAKDRHHRPSSRRAIA